jgi:hypothetical protein
MQTVNMVTSALTTPPERERGAAVASDTREDVSTSSNSVSSSDGRVAKIQRRIGGAVLIPCKGKAAIKPWGELKPDDMTPQYLAALEPPAVDIGVALGEVSRDLCVLDFDDEATGNLFLRLNPALNGTLRTKGASWGALWVRLAGEYPKRIKHWDVGEKHLGEYRAKGYSIIDGIHEDTGEQYRVVNDAEPMLVSLDEIIFPPQCYIEGALLDTVSESENGEAIHTPGCLTHYNSIEAAVLAHLPDGPRQNDACLFKLARALKFNLGREITREELNEAFDLWFARTLYLGFIRADRNHYRNKLMRSYKNAIIPLGETPLEAAWKRSQAAPWHPDANRHFIWSDTAGGLLNLCWQLEVITPGNWFVSCRDAARLIGVTPQTASRLMRQFVEKGLLQVVTPAVGRRCPHYRWTGSRVGVEQGQPLSLA